MTTSAAAAPAMASRIACHHCGTVHVREPLPPGRVANCRRCGLFLYAPRPDGIARGIALHVAASVMWLVAHVFPLISIEIQGTTAQANLLTGFVALADEGFWHVAAVGVLFASVFPALRIVLGLCALIEAGRGRPSPAARMAYRLTRLQGPWSMLEVYLLGLIVSYVKLMSYADISVGPAAVALFATILLVSWADTVTDPDDVWSRIGRPVEPSAENGAACHDCGFIASPGTHECPRCGAGLHRRKTASTQRTWALLLTAMLLYIPANTYPMMVITNFGTAYPGTILGGVIDLIELGDYPVAVVIFIASVLVPILKFLALLFLLLSVQMRSTRHLRRKTQLYAAVEWIGRWSMVDVFVVAVLTGLVKVGSLFSIDAGIGALAFCGVVVITMIAAMAFDPRLLWDSLGDRHDRV